MIRLEVVLKDKWGDPLKNGAIERRIKSELLESVRCRAELDDLEIVRVQFLAAPTKRNR